MHCGREMLARATDLSPGLSDPRPGHTIPRACHREPIPDSQHNSQHNSQHTVNIQSTYSQHDSQHLDFSKLLQSFSVEGWPQK